MHVLREEIQIRNRSMELRQSEPDIRHYSRGELPRNFRISHRSSVSSGWCNRTVELPRSHLKSDRRNAYLKFAVVKPNFELTLNDLKRQT
jgi:hypothetical protein